MNRRLIGIGVIVIGLGLVALVGLLLLVRAFRIGVPTLADLIDQTAAVEIFSPADGHSFTVGSPVPIEWAVLQPKSFTGFTFTANGEQLATLRDFDREADLLSETFEWTPTSTGDYTFEIVASSEAEELAASASVTLIVVESEAAAATVQDQTLNSYTDETWPTYIWPPQGSTVCPTVNFQWSGPVGLGNYLKQGVTPLQYFFGLYEGWYPNSQLILLVEAISGNSILVALKPLQQYAWFSGAQFDWSDYLGQNNPGEHHGLYSGGYGPVEFTTKSVLDIGCLLGVGLSNKQPDIGFQTPPPVDDPGPGDSPPPVSGSAGVVLTGGGDDPGPGDSPLDLACTNPGEYTGCGGKDGVVVCAPREVGFCSEDRQWTCLVDTSNCDSPPESEPDEGGGEPVQPDEQPQEGSTSDNTNTDPTGARQP